MKKKIFVLILSVLLILSFTIPSFAYTNDISDSGAYELITNTSVESDDVGTVFTKGNLPSKYSSRELNYTTPVKNQTGTNICWAYSTLDTFETLTLKNGEKIDGFSPSSLDIWAIKKDTGFGWQRNFNAAGSTHIALSYLTSWNGPKSIIDCPITINKEIAKSNNDKSKAVAFANSLTYVDCNNINSPKSAIYEYGAITASFNYQKEYLNEETSSYYTNLTRDEILQNPSGHSISIVGWDDNYPKTNFNSSLRPKNNGAWYCKNSYGEHWCNDGGYFWISYEDTSIFTNIFGKTIAITDYLMNDGTYTINQVEEYGATGHIGHGLREDSTSDSSTMIYMNILDFSEDSTILKKVNFETEKENLPFSVYYVPINADGTISQNIDEWTCLKDNCITDHIGYHSIDIDSFNIPVNETYDSKTNTFKGGIAIRFTVTKEEAASIGIDISINPTVKKEGVLSLIPDAKKNTSFVIDDSLKSVTDLFDIIASSPAYDIYYYYDEGKEIGRAPNPYGANFVIKAITKNETFDMYGDTDGNTVVDILDATCIQKYLAELISLDKTAILRGDANGNKVTDIIDAQTIQKYLANIPTKNVIGQKVEK